MDDTKERYTEAHELIRKTAFKSLMDRGLSKTSYTSIADEAGVSRPLVQYYYPKKSVLMTEFLERVLELSETYAVESGLMTGSRFVDYYMTGYMHFYFLLKNEQLLPLTRDLVSEREYTVIGVEAMAKWQHRFDDGLEVTDAQITDAMLLSVGGAYELIAYHLDHGIEIDIPLLVSRAIHTFIVDLGLDPGEFDQRYSEHLLDEDAIAAASRYILEHIVQ